MPYEAKWGKESDSQNKIKRKVLYNLKIGLLYMLVKSITHMPVRTVQQITVSFIKGLTEFLNTAEILYSSETSIC